MIYVKSPRLWGAAASFALTVGIGYCRQITIDQSFLIATSLIFGLWFGGLLPLWISIIRHRDTPRSGQVQREWSGGLLISLLLVTNVGILANTTATMALVVSTPGLILAYAGGKYGCYHYGCCDWSARFVVARWSLPWLESLTSLSLCTALVGIACAGGSDRMLLVTGALGLGLIRQTSLFLRDEPIFYLKSFKVDGVLLLLSAPIIALM